MGWPTRAIRTGEEEGIRIRRRHEGDTAYRGHNLEESYEGLAAEGLGSVRVRRERVEERIWWRRSSDWVLGMLASPGARRRMAEVKVGRRRIHWRPACHCFG